jgi:hypothetical protein
MTSKSLEFKISGIIKLAKMVNTQEAARDAITRRHPPIPAPSQVESHQAKPLATTFIKKGSIY